MGARMSKCAGDQHVYHHFERFVAIDIAKFLGSITLRNHQDRSPPFTDCALLEIVDLLVFVIAASGATAWASPSIAQEHPGKSKYMVACSGCHSESGKGQGPFPNGSISQRQT